jgi:hypothetical protein
MTATTLLQRQSITVSDFRCSAGPDDTPYAEWHRCHSVSYVRKGSFGCKSRGRFFELVAGSVLVGNAGDEYVCRHDHVCGDECLSFFLAPELVQAIGDRAEIWQIGAAPPLPELMVLGELAQAAADGRSDVGLDEVGALFASRFVEVISGQGREPAPAAARDRRRAVETALWIDAHSHQEINLEHAAAQAGISPSTSCGCSRACSASPRINIWCARGCGMRHGFWPTMTGPLPMSPTTSDSAIFPTSCAPSIAPRASRRADSARPRAGCARFSKNAWPCTD